MRIARGLLPFLFAGALAGPAAAQKVGQYRACLVLAGRDAPAAYEAALAWRAEGGGAAALHCAAVALVNQGSYAAGAEHLEVAADELPAEDRAARAAIIGQAGNAWLLSGDLDAAEAALTRALGLLPEDPGLLVDRARIAAERGDFQSALASLDAALVRRPEDDDALAFRANALRRLDRPAEALDSAEHAVRFNPSNPSARLERGLARQATGDLAGAQADFAQVAREFRGTPAGDAAAALLQEGG